MKFIHTIKYIAISMLVVGGLAACDQPGPAETAGKNIDQTLEKAGDKISGAADKVGETMHEQSNKAGVALDDTAITTRVKAAIFAEPGLDTLQINVVTVKGVVTLSGSVDSRAQSDRAKALAGAMSGVRKVTNHLTIKSD
jgi:hyperosmotically inducible protein